MLPLVGENSGPLFVGSSNSYMILAVRRVPNIFNSIYLTVLYSSTIDPLTQIVYPFPIEVLDILQSIHVLTVVTISEPGYSIAIIVAV